MQFLEDAKWLGVPEEAAFSRAELRRRRDQLMAKHHPDRGGDAVAAAEVNEIYKRMVEWLKRRERRERRMQKEPAKVSFSTKARAAAVAIGSVAILALATLRRGRGR